MGSILVINDWSKLQRYSLKVTKTGKPNTIVIAANTIIRRIQMFWMRVYQIRPCRLAWSLTSCTHCSKYFLFGPLLFSSCKYDNTVGDCLLVSGECLIDTVEPCSVVETLSQWVTLFCPPPPSTNMVFNWHSTTNESMTFTQHQRTTPWTRALCTYLL